jgi:hypothetical protein
MSCDWPIPNTKALDTGCHNLLAIGTPPLTIYRLICLLYGAPHPTTTFSNAQLYEPDLPDLEHVQSPDSHPEFLRISSHSLSTIDGNGVSPRGRAQFKVKSLSLASTYCSSFWYLMAPRSSVLWRKRRQSLGHRQAQTSPACRLMVLLSTMVRCPGRLTFDPHHTILVPGHLTTRSQKKHVGAPQSHDLPSHRFPGLTWTMSTHRSSPRTPSTPSSTASFLTPITSAAAPHLALFQSLSDHIRSNPEFVIDRITEWLCAPDSPRTWAILALCLRGTAHESVDANRDAREDYGRVLLLWDDLLNDLGFEKVRRWKVNMQFANSRFRSLGGDVDSTFGLALWRLRVYCYLQCCCKTINGELV